MKDKVILLFLLIALVWCNGGSTTSCPGCTMSAIINKHDSFWIGLGEADYLPTLPQVANFIGNVVDTQLTNNVALFSYDAPYAFIPAPIAKGIIKTQFMSFALNKNVTWFQPLYTHSICQSKTNSSIWLMNSYTRLITDNTNYNLNEETTVRKYDTGGTHITVFYVNPHDPTDIEILVLAFGATFWWKMQSYGDGWGPVITGTPGNVVTAGDAVWGSKPVFNATACCFIQNGFISFNGYNCV